MEAGSRLTPLCDQAAVDSEADKWASLWLSPVGAPPPPTFGVAELRSAALTFPVGTGTGVDNVSPRAFARLSDHLLMQLATILLVSEACGRWASSLCAVVIVLLPKQDGGRRPIGLMHGVVRLWARVRGRIAREWEIANFRPIHLWRGRHGRHPRSLASCL
jgi:hypothetical protein